MTAEEISKLHVQHIQVPGAENTVIFLHDSLGCVKLWRDFPKDFAETCRCDVIIYDRQGYGESCRFTYTHRTNEYMEWEADILYQLCVLKGIQSPILFGHSDGGSIAIIAAGKYPNFFKAVITEGAHVLVEQITLDGIQSAVNAYTSTNLHDKLMKYHGDKTEDLFWAWANTWRSPNFRSWNIESFVRQMTCPSLIIQGEADEYGTLKQVDSIVNQSKGLSQKLVLSKIKHSPHKENPAAVLSACKNFIENL